VPPKDPHATLGVEAGATPDEIKAAWRRLARAHHPDLTGDDPVTASRATRRMAEINDAYAALTRENGRSRRSMRRERGAGGPGFGWSEAGTGTGTGQRPFDEARRAGPPPPRPTRPVTGRVDMSHTVRPRNTVLSPRGARHPLPGQPPLRMDRRAPELRASDPTGPLERDILAGYRPPERPSLEDALETELEFGKFHGHTLGEVAAFEPSYIDWLAGTMTRNPELVAAARVIVNELDRRGIHRAHRPARPGWRSNPFR
jgi:curved DNA-binding protein CbpA